MKYICTCCGYKTLSREPPGSYEICPVCFWEDDLFQYKDIDSISGANAISLREARDNFKKFGASKEEYMLEVRRPTLAEMQVSKYSIVGHP